MSEGTAHRSALLDHLDEGELVEQMHNLFYLLVRQIPTKLTSRNWHIGYRYGSPLLPSDVVDLCRSREHALI